MIGSSSSPGISPLISKLMHLFSKAANVTEVDFIRNKKLDVFMLINVLIILTVDFVVIITSQSKR